jgi:glycosidase
MKNFANPDGHVRSDFPGGWPTDTINKFTPRGRTETENEAFNFLAGIANWRKQNQWFGSSKLTQFVPRDGVYVYFRHTPEQSLMVIVNQNESASELDLTRFRERTTDVGFSTGQNILNHQSHDITGNLLIEPSSVLMLHLK